MIMVCHVLFILFVFYVFPLEQKLHKVLYFGYLAVSKATHKIVPSIEYTNFVEQIDEM